MSVFQYGANLAEFDEYLHGSHGDPTGDDLIDDSLGECEYCGEACVTDEDEKMLRRIAHTGY